MTVLLVVAIVVGGATPAVGAPENDPPAVDAGLDQQVQRGATVLLDGTSSRDPDGRIESVTWRIEAPNGTTVEPDCPTCERTTFDADRLGTYRVTLTATDGDGATATDRLEVRVVPEPRPTVRLSGPDTVDAGEHGTYVATASIENESLGYVVWTVDGTRIATGSLSGREAMDSVRIRHRMAGRDVVRATVYDMEGQGASASQAVTVTSSPPASTPGIPPGPGTGPSPSTPPAASVSIDDLSGGDGGVTTGGVEDDPTAPTTPSSFEPSVDLNDARRTTWLVEEEPETPAPDGGSDDPGFVMPTGWSPGGGGASGAVKVGPDEDEQSSDDESTEYVNVLSHTTMELAGQETADPGGSSVTYVGLGGISRTRVDG